MSHAASTQPLINSCFHCGLSMPAGVDINVMIAGQDRPVCCYGCQAVASAIVDGGLSRFYQYRSANAERPDDNKNNAFDGYDLPAVQADVVEPLDDGRLRIRLLLSGITCAACAWLIEKYLGRLQGIERVRVNVTQHHCTVEWRSDVIKLSEIFQALHNIGYQATPLTDSNVGELRRRENRRFLQRLGVAGLGMMQVGMVAIALYAGAFQGMDPIWENYLRWISLLFVTPVVLFSAQPFFRAAWRSLQLRSLTMDVSVSLAIGLAFGASCWATWNRSGEVYFDSVAMFTFFLLLGRYLEMNMRHRNATDNENMEQLLPVVVMRIETDGSEAAMPVRLLQAGDIIRVGAGDILPCDGEVVEGKSAVVEAMLTGEPQPILKNLGDTVSAGTCNSEHPLKIRVTAVGLQTRLSAILSLTDEASSERPKLVALADRMAGYFVATVLLIAAVSAFFWWQQSPQQALWITISVLVVTCPCALSLATPAALAVATGALRRNGFLVSRGHVLETLASADRIVFDKTGTLTTADMAVLKLLPLVDTTSDQLLSLAAALETGSSHPIANAFHHISVKPAVTELRQHIAEGVSATIGGVEHALGKPQFVASLLGILVPSAPPVEPGQTLLLLANTENPLGWIILQDQLRDNAAEVIDALKAKGIEPLLYSGDRVATVSAMADQLAISQWQGEMSPADKLQSVRQLQQQGHKVIMVGDGINDVPVLSGADVSIAMGSAADFAQVHADSVLLSGNLQTLVSVVTLARRTRQIVRQNLSWALLYNLVALPLAVMGFVPPWAAAIGMSASSLLVVVNALRLGKPL